jgi:hypothetical protein
MVEKTVSERLYLTPMGVMGAGPYRMVEKKVMVEEEIEVEELVERVGSDEPLAIGREELPIEDCRSPLEEGALATADERLPTQLSEADERLKAMARELRDQWMEQMAGAGANLVSAGKYDLTRTTARALLAA